MISIETKKIFYWLSLVGKVTLKENSSLRGTPVDLGFYFELYLSIYLSIIRGIEKYLSCKYMTATELSRENPLLTSPLISTN